MELPSGLSLPRGTLHLYRNIQCSGTSSLGTSGEIAVPVHLAPQQEMVFSLNVYCECNGTKREVVSFDDALHRVHCEKNASPLASIDIYTSNEQPVLRESSPANSFIPSEGLLEQPARTLHDLSRPLCRTHADVLACRRRPFPTSPAPSMG